jgi:hypothetical protein
MSPSSVKSKLTRLDALSSYLPDIKHSMPLKWRQHHPCRDFPREEGYVKLPDWADAGKRSTALGDHVSHAFFGFINDIICQRTNGKFYLALVPVLESFIHACRGSSISPITIDTCPQLHAGEIPQTSNNAFQ